MQMQFLISVKPVFNVILSTFQRQEPLIHVLHDECVQLVRKHMLRFLKSEVVDGSSKKLAQVDVQNVDNQLSGSRMEVGEETRRTLSTLQANQQKIPLLGMRAFLQSTSKYLLTLLPITDTFVRDLTVLHPKMQKVSSGERCVRRIAQKLAQVIKENQIPSIVDEWKVYQLQDIPEDWYKTDDAGNTPTRIDHYWSKVLKMKTLSGTEMFPTLKKLVKAVLTLSW